MALTKDPSEYFAFLYRDCRISTDQLRLLLDYQNCTNEDKSAYIAENKKLISIFSSPNTLVFTLAHRLQRRFDDMRETALVKQLRNLSTLSKPDNARTSSAETLQALSKKKKKSISSQLVELKSNVFQEPDIIGNIRTHLGEVSPDRHYYFVETEVARALGTHLLTLLFSDPRSTAELMQYQKSKTQILHFSIKDALTKQGALTYYIDPKDPGLSNDHIAFALYLIEQRQIQHFDHALKEEILADIACAPDKQKALKRISGHHKTLFAENPREYRMSQLVIDNIRHISFQLFIESTIVQIQTQLQPQRFDFKYDAQTTPIQNYLSLKKAVETLNDPHDSAHFQNLTQRLKDIYSTEFKVAQFAEPELKYASGLHAASEEFDEKNESGSSSCLSFVPVEITDQKTKTKRYECLVALSGNVMDLRHDIQNPHETILRKIAQNSQFVYQNQTFTYRYVSKYDKCLNFTLTQLSKSLSGLNSPVNHRTAELYLPEIVDKVCAEKRLTSALVSLLETHYHSLKS